MKKSVMMASAFVLAVSLVTSAIAGERTGNGGFTPIGTLTPTGTHAVVAAICSFSGLEDHEGEAVTPGDTQTPHESGGTIEAPGSASICSVLNPGKVFKPAR